MNPKRRIHDAIVGVVVTAGVALGYYVACVSSAPSVWCTTFKRPAARSNALQHNST
jgi:hypothetical protein